MIPVKEALEIILREIKPLPVEDVLIGESPGRVLAKDVFAKRSNPPWDNSAMDGYAVRSVDISEASRERPVTLSVLYDLPAGKTPKGRVRKGEAVRIMTGAPVPPGADSVVMVENTERRKNTVLVLASAKKGENIRKKGEDFRTGELVLKEGSVIRPAEVLMLATIGQSRATVRRRPVVAVLSTGDELVDIDTVPEPGKITNSNGYALASLVREAGATAVQLGIARDTRKSLLGKLKEAAKADCLVSSGGVSVGDYDLVKDVLKEMGSEMRFWKVAIKPGKPLAFGILSGKPAFGLPGNPISSMVAFEQFVRPALLKMMGRKDIFRRAFPARLTGEIRIKPGRMNFIRAELTVKDGRFSATPLEGQGSGIVSTMVRANSFIIVPAEVTLIREGETVNVQPFDPAILQSGGTFL